jgi:germination protein M
MPPLPEPQAGAPAPRPPALVTSEIVTLYFGDSTGSLYVPVQRAIRVENRQVALAAVRELIAGPRTGLQRLLLPNVRVLGVAIENGTARVNLDRHPTGQGDTRGFYAIVFTLTEFPSIQRVQLQVNGRNIGINGAGPIARPTINPINPQALANDVRQTSFLPLYFLSNDGAHSIRLIRMVPKTQQTAEGTLRALLDGPAGYAYAVQRTIPAGVELRGLRLEHGVVIVDFTQPFADAANRDAAVRTITQSLTTLPNVRGVQFLVEGHPLTDWWGQPYGQVFGRPLINPD